MLQYAGVPQGLISSCGIPIVPSFLETGTREQCRKSLGAWARAATLTGLLVGFRNTERAREQDLATTCPWLFKCRAVETCLLSTKLCWK